MHSSCILDESIVLLSLSVYLIVKLLKSYKDKERGKEEKRRLKAEKKRRWSMSSLMVDINLILEIVFDL